MIRSWVMSETDRLEMRRTHASRRQNQQHDGRVGAPYPQARGAHPYGYEATSAQHPPRPPCRQNYPSSHGYPSLGSSGSSPDNSPPASVVNIRQSPPRCGPMPPLNQLMAMDHNMWNEQAHIYQEIKNETFEPYSNIEKPLNLLDFTMGDREMAILRDIKSNINRIDTLMPYSTEDTTNVMQHHITFASRISHFLMRFDDILNLPDYKDYIKMNITPIALLFGSTFINLSSSSYTHQASGKSMITNLHSIKNKLGSTHYQHFTEVLGICKPYNVDQTMGYILTLFTIFDSANDKKSRQKYLKLFKQYVTHRHGAAATELYCNGLISAINRFRLKVPVFESMYLEAKRGLGGKIDYSDKSHETLKRMIQAQYKNSNNVNYGTPNFNRDESDCYSSVSDISTLTSPGTPSPLPNMDFLVINNSTTDNLISPPPMSISPQLQQSPHNMIGSQSSHTSCSPQIRQMSQSPVSTTKSEPVYYEMKPPSHGPMHDHSSQQSYYSGNHQDTNHNECSSPHPTVTSSMSYPYQYNQDHKPLQAPSNLDSHLSNPGSDSGFSNSSMYASAVPSNSDMDLFGRSHYNLGDENEYLKNDITHNSHDRISSTNHINPLMSDNLLSFNNLEEPNEQKYTPPY